MTRGYVIVFSATICFLFVAACKTAPTTNTNTARATPGSTPDQFAAVRTIFEKDCKECHGQDGQGGRVTLKDGTKLKVPTLREGHALRHKDEEFVKQITKGGDGMPAFAEKLKPAEINELIKFIRHEFQGGVTTAAK